jgi:hypothetical protein
MSSPRRAATHRLESAPRVATVRRKVVGAGVLTLSVAATAGIALLGGPTAMGALHGTTVSAWQNVTGHTSSSSSGYRRTSTSSSTTHRRRNTATDSSSSSLGGSVGTVDPVSSSTTTSSTSLVDPATTDPTETSTSTSTSTKYSAPSSTTTTSSTASTTSTTTSATVKPASAGSWWKPTTGATWQWQLTGTLDLSPAVDVFDLDMVDTTASTVAAIHAKGAHAVCYLETGAWENYRPDAGSYPASVLGGSIGGYPNERYVDLRQISVLRPIIDARLDACKAKGFDGVEPDIDDSFVDVGANGVGFPVTYADQIAFNSVVASDAHARGLAIGLKNGTFGNNVTQFASDMEALTDFSVNEECSASGHVCNALAPFTKHGKPVFHTEYLNDYSSASETNYQQVLNTFCPTTKGLGFSSILKDASASLSAWRVPCP